MDTKTLASRGTPLPPPSPRMTVSRLTDLLKGMPPDAIVFVPGYGRELFYEPFDQPKVQLRNVVTYGMDGGHMGMYDTTVAANADVPKFAVSRSEPHQAVILKPETCVVPPAVANLPLETSDSDRSPAANRASRLQIVDN